MLKEKNCDPSNMMRIITILRYLAIHAAIYQVDVTSAQTCSRFNRISVGQKPSEDPYKTIDVLMKVDAKCFSICSHQQQCRAFLVEDKHPIFKCHFYNVTIELLTLVPGDSGMAFHSVDFGIFRDCVDWYNAGARETGVYQITLPGGPKNVRCNMEVDGGGWLVFQHRFNGTVDFDVGWEMYKNGFGSVDGEFWLGNDLLHKLTTLHESELNIHAGRFTGESHFTKYSSFFVENESAFYKLHFGTRIVGIEAIGFNRLQPFTTRDSNNGPFSGNCATYGSFGYGGFWYNACSFFFPNSEYVHQEECPSNRGLIWSDWLSRTQSLKWTELMFRRTDKSC